MARPGLTGDGPQLVKYLYYTHHGLRWALECNGLITTVRPLRARSWSIMVLRKPIEVTDVMENI